VGIVKIIILVVPIFRGVNAKLERLGLKEAKATVEDIRHFGVELDGASESKGQCLSEQEPSFGEGAIINNNHHYMGCQHEFGESIHNRENNEDGQKQPILDVENRIEEKWWNLYDNLRAIIGEMNVKRQSKMLTKSSSLTGPSWGQRSRGFESLNILTDEAVAVMISGGIGTALGAKPNKNIDKAIVLRGEGFPSITFRLVILYLCKAYLERALQCA